MDPAQFGTEVANSRGMRSLHALALTTALLGTSACYVEVVDNDGPPSHAWTGDLTLRYDFDGLRCDEAGVHRIAIRLDGRRTGEVYRDNIDCDDYAHGVTIEYLSEDSYDVSLEGRDAQGVLLYALESSTAVQVVAGAHQEYDLRIVSQGSGLTLYWTFEGLGSCGIVDEVQVQLTDPDGFIFDDSRYPCEYGGVSYDAMMEGLWALDIDGVAADGRVHYRAAPRNLVIIEGANNDYTIDLDSYR